MSVLLKLQEVSQSCQTSVSGCWQFVLVWVGQRRERCVVWRAELVTVPTLKLGSMRKEVSVPTLKLEICERKYVTRFHATWAYKKRSEYIMQLKSKGKADVNLLMPNSLRDRTPRWCEWSSSINSAKIITAFVPIQVTIRYLTKQMSLQFP